MFCCTLFYFWAVYTPVWVAATPSYGALQALLYFVLFVSFSYICDSGYKNTDDWYLLVFINRTWLMHRHFPDYATRHHATLTLDMNLLQSRTSPLHAQFSFDDCSVPPTKWCCLCDPLISVLILPFPHSFTRSRHASLVPSFTKYSQKDPIPKLSTHHLRHSSRFRLVLIQVPSQCDTRGAQCQSPNHRLEHNIGMAQSAALRGPQIHSGL